MNATGTSWQDRVISTGPDVRKPGSLRDITIRAALDEIRTGTRDATAFARCRELAVIAAHTGAEEDKRACQKHKRENLSFLTFSGRFRRRANAALIEHSGILCIDLDHLTPDRVSAARAKLIADERTAAVFLSPSALGLKVLLLAAPVPRNAGEHKTAYAAAQAVVATLTGEELDATSDVSRACFVSEDRSMFVRENPGRWSG